jgi:hypothetical protein
MTIRLAALHESGFGTKRHSLRAQNSVGFGAKRTLTEPRLQKADL